MTARLFQYTADEISPFIRGLCEVIAVREPLPVDWALRVATAIRAAMPREQAKTVEEWSAAQVTGVALGLAPLTGRYPSHLRHHADELVDHVITTYVERKALPFDYIKVVFPSMPVWLTAPSAFAAVATVAGGAQVQRLLERLDERYPSWMKAQQWVWGQASGTPHELMRHWYSVPGQSAGEVFLQRVLPRLEKASQKNLQTLLGQMRSKHVVKEALRLGLDIYGPAYVRGQAADEAYYTHLNKTDPGLFDEVCAQAQVSAPAQAAQGEAKPQRPAMAHRL